VLNTPAFFILPLCLYSSFILPTCLIVVVVELRALLLSPLLRRKAINLTKIFSNILLLVIQVCFVVISLHVNNNDITFEILIGIGVYYLTRQIHTRHLHGLNLRMLMTFTLQCLKPSTAFTPIFSLSFLCPPFSHHTPYEPLFRPSRAVF
jgi:hypothetical protein